MPENYLKLARLLEEHMNDQDAAQEHYRLGLHLLAGDCAIDTQIKTEPDTVHETPQLQIVRS